LIESERNSKLQIPNYKQIPNSKFQITKEWGKEFEREDLK
jgi:hypothetical protein